MAHAPEKPNGHTRALLALIAGIAALLYAWGIASDSLEPFYGAAARSMSTSWHDFLFGAFDPAGTITVDKLPGALWPQALSLRLFGFHFWAIVLPQVVEGVLAVLVLYRAVGRLGGPVAGLTAAAVLTFSPVTVALSRGNVSDSLLILLTVLAADATSTALLSGRRRTLLLAGLWVGLAFQAKMIQAWLILPALALPYLIAAPASLRRRLLDLLLAGAVTLIVSLSWMTAVSLVPAGERPYVDGSQDNSLFSQVFDYNGVARIGHTGLPSSGTPARFLVQTLNEGAAVNSLSYRVQPSWHRLFGGLFGRDAGWLLPASLLAGICVLAQRWRAGRRDPLRALVVMWGTWLLILWALFSDGAYLNAYYLAALSPAIAGLCGAGAALAWERRRDPEGFPLLAAGVIVSIAYGAYLLNGGAGVPGWLLPAAICLGVVHVLVRLRAPGGSRSLSIPGLVTALAGVLTIPAVASATIALSGLGPFATPFQPASPATDPGISEHQASIAAARTVRSFTSTFHTPIAFGADSSDLAASYIMYTGKEILPIGGFLGGVPQPGLPQLQRQIASGQVSAFLVPLSPPSADTRIAWIYTHCRQISRSGGGKGVLLAVYDCTHA